MRRADDFITAIDKIRLIYNISNECKTKEQLIETLHVSDKDLESMVIGIMIDKYRYNKNFSIDKENFIKCRREVKNFFG